MKTGGAREKRCGQGQGQGYEFGLWTALLAATSEKWFGQGKKRRGQGQVCEFGFCQGTFVRKVGGIRNWEGGSFVFLGSEKCTNRVLIWHYPQPTEPKVVYFFWRLAEEIA